MNPAVQTRLPRGANCLEMVMSPPKLSCGLSLSTLFMVIPASFNILCFWSGGLSPAERHKPHSGKQRGYRNSVPCIGRMSAMGDSGPSRSCVADDVSRRKRTFAHWRRGSRRGGGWRSFLGQAGPAQASVNRAFAESNVSRLTRVGKRAFESPQSRDCSEVGFSLQELGKSCLCLINIAHEPCRRRE